MALSITDLKKGTIFSYNSEPYRVIEYSQKVMGRGGSIVNVKIKNLIDGKVLEKTFKGNESVQPADVNSVKAQFLYADDNTSYFMDQSSYETLEVVNEAIESFLPFLKEGQPVTVLMHNDNPIGVEPPKNVELEVIYSENAVKGDTSSSITKQVKVETGASVKVPPFIKTGDKISVDITTGEYRERIKR